MSKNLSDLSGRKGLTKTLFGELGKAAETDGTPGVGSMEKICGEFLFGKANVYGAVSFYDFLKPAGHISFPTSQFEVKYNIIHDFQI